MRRHDRTARAGRHVSAPEQPSRRAVGSSEIRHSLGIRILSATVIHVEDGARCRRVNEYHRARSSRIPYGSRCRHAAERLALEGRHGVGGVGDSDAPACSATTTAGTRRPASTVGSDGLYELVPPEMLVELLAEGGPARDIAERLVARAYDRGGTDNITGIVLRVLDGTGA